MKIKILHIASIMTLTALILSAACTGTSTGNTDPEISGYIEDLYSDDNETLKTAVASLAGRGEAAIDPLIGVFSAGDQKASGYAAVALIYIGEPSIDPLIEKLGSEDKNTTEWASNTLTFIGPAAVPGLIETVNTGSGTQKEMAVVTLIKIGEPALPLLNLELNTNPDADQAEISSIIQSIYATQNLQARLNYTAEAL